MGDYKLHNTAGEAAELRQDALATMCEDIFLDLQMCGMADSIVADRTSADHMAEELAESSEVAAFIKAVILQKVNNTTYLNFQAFSDDWMSKKLSDMAEAEFKRCGV